jgi:hypothetical protein
MQHAPLHTGYYASGKPVLSGPEALGALFVQPILAVIHETNSRAVGLGEVCWPCRLTHFEPLSLESNGTL